MVNHALALQHLIVHNGAVTRSFAETVRHLFRPGHSNNHRSRLLHPEWLVVLVLLVVGVACTSVVAQRYSGQIGFVLGYASDITTDQVLVLTNQERAKSGLAALSLNGKLSSAASAKAADMFAKQYWAHVSPTGAEPWDFIVAAGYSYRVAGENLARDFNHTTDMVQAWMSSPTHRANIMNSRYTEIGLAVVNGTLDGVETTLVVQMFGAPAVAAPQLAQAPPVNEAPAATATPIPTATPAALGVSGVPSPPPPSPTLVAQLTGETPLSPPRSEVLARQVLPTGGIRALTHIDPLSLAKAFGISLILVLLGTLVYDLYAIGHYHSLRIVGKNVAHILFFAVVAFLLLFFKSGVIK